ncbi:hypothetical protein ABZ865_34290 [Streptomyces sp. NPDC047085]|uniref:hypothetical protein n=1 Tax=Streptomyces sp. NPDC047085 TaxID=3155140 RepID=UPI0033DA60EC
MNVADHQASLAHPPVVALPDFWVQHPPACRSAMHDQAGAGQATEAASLIGNGADKIIGGPKKYLMGHFNAMREFYRGASQRQLLIVLWWD